MATKTEKAVVLLSGGVDSATTVAIALSEGYEVYAISFRYGQRHQVELKSAKRVADSLHVAQHVVVDIDLGAFGGSSLTADIDVPKGRSLIEMNAEIAVTYVPARNTVFLSFALGWAEVLGASTIFAGVNALDYSGYPDCRPEYIKAFEVMANLATKASIQDGRPVAIKTPLIQSTKAEIIEIGRQLGVDFSLTSSCYDPSDEGAACGECDACVLRLEGFAENKLQDPVEYREGIGQA